jgi:hypothetical protein
MAQQELPEHTDLKYRIIDLSFLRRGDAYNYDMERGNVHRYNCECISEGWFGWRNHIHFNRATSFTEYVWQLGHVLNIPPETCPLTRDQWFNNNNCLELYERIVSPFSGPSYYELTPYR